MRRRLEVLGENLSQHEKNTVVNKYTQQLVNSGYNWKQCREIIISGIKGHVRKEKLRKEMNMPKFRSGQSSLNARVNKKLLEKYNWFRQGKSIETEKEESKKET